MSVAYLDGREQWAGGPQAFHPLARRLLDPAIRTALVIAHPAHELRVFQWMRLSRPSAFILTTGSRSGDDLGRLTASAREIAGAGGSLVAAWGGVLDRDLYGEVLAGRSDMFVERTMALADHLVARDVELVVTDSWQFYNVAHDLTHCMARAAASCAGRILARDIPVVDYPVMPHILVGQAPRGATVASLDLSAVQVAVKRAVVDRMPRIGVELAEIEAAEGAEGLAREQFHEAPPVAALAPRPGFKPYYETFGEARVRTGLYGEVIRWSHVQPIVEAIRAL